MAFDLKKICVPVCAGLALFISGYLALTPWKGQSGTLKTKETEPVIDRASKTKITITLSPNQSDILAESENPLGSELSASLPTSLQGSAKPAAVDVDENGHLIINIKIRNLFDFYLSALGEETEEELILRIKRDLANLPPQAEIRALEILDGYINYKKAIDTYLSFEANYIPQVPGDTSKANIRAAERKALELKKEMRSLREGFLDAETSEAFYGFEDRHDDYIEVLDGFRDDESLSETDKFESQIEALEPMPGWFQEQEMRKINQKRLKALDKGSMSSTELFAERAKIVGSEAASRLDALDKRRAEWTNRKDVYKKSKAELDEFWGDKGNPNYQEALERLQANSFTPEERLRLIGQEHLDLAIREENNRN